MTTTAIVLIVALLIVLAGVAWMLYRQQRRKALRNRFGPEYSHAVRQYGDESRAADALAARERRMEKIHIRSLSHEDHERFGDQWQAVQRDFVDDPAASIQRADALVCDVMRARGYPMSDFEHRAEDISVDHPHVVQKFRAAHVIAERHAHGEAGTEDLRQALVFYRDLFDDLLEAHPAGERTNRR
jgi:ABC-type nickel/cobalt efflux system permease component RcnA